VTPVAPGTTRRRSARVLLPHLPLNFAGRFSRKRRTPSLKSSAAPALRCICWFEDRADPRTSCRGFPVQSFGISDSATVGPSASSCASFHGLVHQRRVVIDAIGPDPIPAPSPPEAFRPSATARPSAPCRPTAATARSIRNPAPDRAAEGLQEIRRARAQDHVAHQRETHPAPAAAPLTEVTIGQAGYAAAGAGKG